MISDPLLGFRESETEHGPVLHFPTLPDELEAGSPVPHGEDLLGLAADLAESTGRPVDVFLADVGVRAHAAPEVPRLSVVLRIDHEGATS